MLRPIYHGLGEFRQIVDSRAQGAVDVGWEFRTDLDRGREGGDVGADAVYLFDERIEPDFTVDQRYLVGVAEDAEVFRVGARWLGGFWFGLRFGGVGAEAGGLLGGAPWHPKERERYIAWHGLRRVGVVANVTSLSIYTFVFGGPCCNLSQVSMIYRIQSSKIENEFREK